mmetsp:Transcript_11168/g.29073  ORF Transcript_11168/g.29073 Transcript_11168/m.29073 type:complete len:206 (+) Transcript_11168:290-907(+)
MIAAWPIPPSAHAAMRAKRPSSRMRRLAAVVTRRAPVAPNGWPSESEPPCTLNLSIGTAPTLSMPPSRSLANASESSAVRLARTWAAKASWNSITSKSFNESPVFLSSREVANAGPSSRSSNGSCETKMYSRRNALGLRPSDLALASDMTRQAEAPSVRKLELAAVTVPYGFTNAGLSVASFSSVDSPRTPLSAVSPANGTISSA